MLIYVWAFEQEYKKQKSKYLKDQNKVHPENHSAFDSTPEDAEDSSGKTSASSNRHLEDEFKPVANMQKLTKVTNSKLSVHTNRTAFNTQDLLVPWHLKDEKKRVEGESGGSGKKAKRKEKLKKTLNNSCSASSSRLETGLDCKSDLSPVCESNVPSRSCPDTSDATHSSDSKRSLSGDTTEVSNCSQKSESTQAPIFHRYYHVFQQGELEQLCVQVAGVTVQSSYHDQGNWCVILEKDLER